MKATKAQRVADLLDRMTRGEFRELARVLVEADALDAQRLRDALDEALIEAGEK